MPVAKSDNCLGSAKTASKSSARNARSNRDASSPQYAPVMIDVIVPQVAALILIVDHRTAARPRPVHPHLMRKLYCVRPQANIASFASSRRDSLVAKVCSTEACGRYDF